MARTKDLRRGYKINPLGARVPVAPAPGQPDPREGRRFMPPVPQPVVSKPKRPSRGQALTAAAFQASASTLAGIAGKL